MTLTITIDITKLIEANIEEIAADGIKIDVCDTVNGQVDLIIDGSSIEKIAEAVKKISE